MKYIKTVWKYLTDDSWRTELIMNRFDRLTKKK